MCPLCNSTNLTKTPGPLDREYYLCQNCKLIFVDSKDFLKPEKEKARYQTHNNGPDQPGHVAFLSRALNQTEQLFQPNMKILDYGCGPVPTLSVMLKDKGYSCDDYDPLFFSLRKDKQYDVIFSTETFEHFFDITKEMTWLGEHLNENALLIIMTETYTELEKFATWYYARDPTHVIFFHDSTISELAEIFKYEQLPSSDKRVFILKKHNLSLL